MAKLTKRTVEAATTEKAIDVVWDDELRGFGLRVYPTGRKVYIVKCRIKGQQRFITIGQHGPITVDQARSRAYEILSEAKNGRDPARELDQARKAPTVKGLGERFLTEHVAIRCKPSTQYEYRRSVELFINPELGTRKVTDIQRRDIAELHHSLKHIPYQANRTLGVLSKMFNLAEIWGLRADGSNPCLHVKKYLEQKRERFLSTEEFASLGEALRKVEADGSETQSAVNAIRLLMLTGCRLGEIMTLKWEYVNLAAGEFRLPDSKTGAKVVHFGAVVTKILKDIERMDDNPWVITGRKEGAQLTDLQHPWRRIRAMAKLPTLRIHDLRHSYASGALALGEGLTMIGKLLGHTQVQTTARYAHLASDPVKAAAGKVSDVIAAAIMEKAPMVDRPNPEPEAHPEKGGLPKALIAARKRGHPRVTNILEGPEMLSADEFAGLLGTNRAMVHAMRQKCQVLGLEGAEHGFRFPRWQIGGDGKPFPALPALFERFEGSSWAVYRFFVQNHPKLNGRTGQDALRHGDEAAAIAAAESLSRDFT